MGRVAISSLVGVAVTLLSPHGPQALTVSVDSRRQSRAQVADLNIIYPEEPGNRSLLGVQAAYVACGTQYCGLGLEALRSFLAQAKLDGGVKPTAHLFVDESCAAQIDEFKHKDTNLSSAAHLLLYVVSTLKSSPIMNLYKHCAGLRLSLPELLPDLEKVLYMDTDTYVVGSLSPLWNIQPYLWAFAENDLHWYTGGRCPENWEAFVPPERKAEVTHCYLGTAGINSGVMLTNLTTWRKLRIDEEVNYWVRSLTLDGTTPTVLRMGDQDILNIISAVHKRDNYTFHLPCEMNSLHLNRFMCFYGPGNWEDYLKIYGTDKWKNFVQRNHAPLSERRNTRQPVVIHAKFYIKRDGEPVWLALHERLREAVNNVSLGHVPPGARSLCDVIGGCDLS